MEYVNTTRSKQGERQRRVRSTSWVILRSSTARKAVEGRVALVYFSYEYCVLVVGGCEDKEGRHRASWEERKRQEKCKSIQIKIEHIQNKSEQLQGAEKNRTQPKQRVEEKEDRETQRQRQDQGPWMGSKDTDMWAPSLLVLAGGRGVVWVGEGRRRGDGPALANFAASGKLLMVEAAIQAGKLEIVVGDEEVGVLCVCFWFVVSV